MSGRNGYERNDWISESAVVKFARQVMGGIDLDPASSATANEVVKAKRFITEEENGFFGIRGGGRVFLNPPGGSLNVKTGRILPKPKKGEPKRKLPPGEKVGNAPAAWWHQLARAYREGAIDQAVFFGFNIEVLQLAQGRTLKAMNQVLGVPSGDCKLYADLPSWYPLIFPSARCRFQVMSEETFGIEERTGGVNASVLVWLPPKDMTSDDASRWLHTTDYVKQKKGACIVPHDLSSVCVSEAPLGDDLG